MFLSFLLYNYIEKQLDIYFSRCLWTNAACLERTNPGLKGKDKGSFYIAQYPVRWTAQSALHFLPALAVADLFIPTPTRLLREAF